MKKMFTKIAAAIVSTAMLAGVGFVSAKVTKNDAAQVKADSVTETAGFSSSNSTDGIWATTKSSTGGLKTGTSYIQIWGGTYISNTTPLTVDISKTISVTVKTRTYGGPSTAQATLTVSALSGTTELDSKTVAPTNTALTDKSCILDVSSSSSNEITIKVASSSSSTSSKMAGISMVKVVYESGNSVSHYASSISSVASISGFVNESVSAPAVVATYDGVANTEYTNYSASIGKIIEGTYTSRTNFVFGSTPITFDDNNIRITAKDKISAETDEYAFADISLVVTYATLTSIAPSKTSLTLQLEEQSEKITITPTPANADPDVIWTSNNASIATVNDGVVTGISIGETTIIATSSVNSGISTQITIKVTEKAKVFYLLTSIDELTDGTKAVIASKNSSTWYAMSTTQNTNNRSGVVSSVSSNQMTPGSNYAEFTVTKGEKGYLLCDQNGNYLYTASTSNNALKSTTSISDNTYWTINFSNGNLVISNYANTTRGIMQFNTSTNAFCCYSSRSQVDVSMYVISAPAPEVKHVESISFSQTSCEIIEKTSYNTTLSFVPADATNKDVVYVSNDDSIATVSDTGVITAVHAGTTTVTAISEDNEEAVATISVTVVAPTLDSIETVYTETLNGERNKTYTFRGTITQIFFKTIIVQQGTYGITIYKNDESWTNGYNVYDVVEVTSKTTVYKGLVETTTDAVVSLYEHSGTFTTTDVTSYSQFMGLNHNIAININGLVYRGAASDDKAYDANKTAGLYTFAYGNEEIVVKVQSSTENALDVFGEDVLKYGTVLNLTDVVITNYNNKNQISISDMMNVKSSNNAITFAELFLSDDCATNLTDWEDLAETYNELTTSEKEAFKYASYDVATYETNAVVQQCVQRYDLVMSMYPGVYENFMGRETASSSSPAIKSLMDDQSGITTVVTVTAIASITLVGGFTLTRKRKHF